MLKKLFYALFVLTILLSSCGGPDSPAAETDEGGFRIITATPRATSPPTPTPTPIVPEIDPAALKGLPVDFWYFWEPGLEDALAEAVVWFNAGNPDGIMVAARRFTHPGDLQAAVTEAVALGQPPDIVLAEPDQYFPWAEAGAVVELTPYLEHPVYGLKTDEFFPVFQMLGMDGGERWGFMGLFSAQVMLYNQTWAEELGFTTPPARADSFIRQACAAHQSTGDRTGGWMISSSAAQAWLLTFNERPFEALDLKSTGVEAAYNFLLDLNGQGCAWQPSVPYPDQAFIDRLGLFYSVSTREISYVAEAFAQSGSRDEWTAIGYPGNQDQASGILSGPVYLVMGSELESQIAAWLFLKYMAGEKVQTHLAETALYLPLDRMTAAALAKVSALPEAWRDSLGLLDENVVIGVPQEHWQKIEAVLAEAQAEVLDERFVPGTLSLFLDRLDKLTKELAQPTATPVP